MQLSDSDREKLEAGIKRTAAAQRVFNCPDGEIVLKEIKAFCGFETILYDKSCDAIEVAWRVGKRDACQFIMTMLNDDPKRYRKMLDAQTEAEGKKE